jgi:long-subunit acyl-CoA synthetase (AMP-forming)
MGYLNRENETRDVFVPGIETDKESTEGAAANDDQNWLKLGDLGFIDEDGFLVVLGKSENFISLNTNEMICPAKVKSFH